LSGSQASGDTYVRSLLEAALADRELLDEISGDRTALYAAFNRLWNTAHVDVDADSGGDGKLELVAQQRLAQVSAMQRQALLLSTLEEFSLAETAVILNCSEEEVHNLISAAIEEIDSGTITDVLVIEDEPLIAMQLEQLVSGLGHNVTRSAATRDEARAIFDERRPGLVLADIQLADGSSGIDAVEDILKIGDVPVIFITAYPEKLLTGDRPEPTYLVTKPFREETVRAAISQALFFGSSRPLD
jgi:CheY-like chemotaxis protein